MTITMNLEVEEGVSLEDVSFVFSKIGEVCSMDGKYLVGNFRSSNCYFVFREVFPSDDVAAEGALVTWRVGVRGAFHCSVNLLSESSEDIKVFLEGFSTATSFKFVLSFQYESLYALRDESGIRFLNSMVD